MVSKKGSKAGGPRPTTSRVVEVMETEVHSAGQSTSAARKRRSGKEVLVGQEDEAPAANLRPPLITEPSEGEHDPLPPREFMKALMTGFNKMRSLLEEKGVSPEELPGPVRHVDMQRFMDGEKESPKFREEDEVNSSQRPKTLKVTTKPKPQTSHHHVSHRHNSHRHSGEDSEYIPRSEILRLIQENAPRYSPSDDPDERGKPYQGWIRNYKRPYDWVPPKYKKYNGNGGNPREHVQRFLEDLGRHYDNDALALVEFPKSLTDTPYSWFYRLDKSRIVTFEQLSDMFVSRFFQIEEEVYLWQLVHSHPHKSNEELVQFIKRFSAQTLKIKAPHSEKEFVVACKEAMLPTYKAHIASSTATTYRQLAEVARTISKAIPLEAAVPQNGSSSRRNPLPIRANPPTSAPTPASNEAVGHPGGNGDSKRKRSSDFFDTPDYPIPMHQVLSTLDDWVRSNLLRLPYVKDLPTEEDKKHPRYCAYHRYVGHPTSECVNLKKIINASVEESKATGGNKRQDKDIRRNPLPNNGVPPPAAYMIEAYGEEYDYGQGCYVVGEAATDPVMPGYVVETSEVAKEAGLFTEEVLALDKGKAILVSDEASREPISKQDSSDLPQETILKLMTSSKFKTFFDALGFDKETRWDATKALASIASRNNLPPLSGVEFKSVKKYTDTITFSEEDRSVDLPHNKALMISGKINGVELNRVLVDGGSGINIMPYHIYKELGLRERDLVKTTVTIQGFDGETVRCRGKAQITIRTGDLVSQITVYVPEIGPNYEVLLGRPWIHANSVVPSTLHQCAKAIPGGKPVTIQASKETPYEVANAATSSLPPAVATPLFPIKQGYGESERVSREVKLLPPKQYQSAVTLLPPKAYRTEGCHSTEPRKRRREDEEKDRRPPGKAAFVRSSRVWRRN